MNWVDFRAVKQAVSMEMALAYYGAMFRRVDGSYVRGRCPLPSHRSKSSTLSFIVNTEKNVWICHSDSCVASRGGGHSGGNVLDFVAAMERCSIRDAALKLRDRFAITPADAPRKEILSAAEWPNTSAPTITGDCNRPLAFRLWDVDLRHPYLAERGVDHLTADHFGIGFYPGKGCMEGRIVIPIHNEDGILVAYAGRALGPSEPKYRFPARFRKSLVLFNLHRAVRYGKTVVLVEGFFDCLKVHQAGLPCVVALMGCSLSQRQQALLQQHFRQVTLMLDGDNAGRSAGAMIAARLITKVAVRIVEVPVGSQPDRLSADQIRCLSDPDYF